MATGARSQSGHARLRLVPGETRTSFPAPAAAEVNSEADLQNLASVAYEPSCFWGCESHRPKAARLRQGEPGMALVGSPGGRPGTEVGFGFGGDYDRVIEVLVARFSFAAVAGALDVGETKNRARDGRRIRKATVIAPALGELTSGVS